MKKPRNRRAVHVKLRNRRAYGRPPVELRGVRTQQEVADALGWSRAYVSQLERRAFAKIKRYLTQGMVTP